MSETTLMIPEANAAWMPEGRRQAWGRFASEFSTLIKEADTALLKEWGHRSMAAAVDVAVTRFKNLVSIVTKVAGGLWAELKRAFRSLINGRFTDYVVDLCGRVVAFFKRLWAAVIEAGKAFWQFVRSLPTAGHEKIVDTVTSFVGGVLGFIIIGGKGDGGLIDEDIDVFGLGGHRSILFHSLLIGVGAEACVRSTFELIDLLYNRLPKNHSPIWDRLRQIHDRFAQALITGSWVGVATHLAIDSHVGGWTPYKDIPVVLPNWGHHMVMDMNAAGSGWLAWQWYDKVKRHFRDNAIMPQTVDGRPLATI
jgi:hypothetical protein